MNMSGLKRQKEMEAELIQLKRMYADLAFENRAMKDHIEKNSKTASEARCAIYTYHIILSVSEAVLKTV